jgi:DDE family transposase
VAWGIEPVMSRAEQEGLAYLFRLRMTANVRRALTKMMAERDWTNAGHGWQGKETTLRLMGWSRQRRVVLLRRKLDRPLMLVDRAEPELPLLSFAEVGANREVWEYAALVTSLDSEIVTLGQLYRDRGDCENTFDELKNQWGWGGFTTHDLKRCRLLAGSVALIFNWWSLFVRLADLDHRPEAITSRPLLMQAIARQTQHAGQVTLTITSTHGEQPKARRAYRRIACFLAKLRQTAEQLDPVQRWYRILSEALKRYLSGRQLDPPPRLAPA